jgi:hypothetical protein
MRAYVYQWPPFRPGARSIVWSINYLRSSKSLDCCVFKSYWAWVLVCDVGLNFKTMTSLLWPLVTMKLTVATGAMKSSGPIAIVIGPTWQWLKVARGALTTSTRCYCDICVKFNMAHLPFTSLHKKILSTESSPPDPHSARSSMLVAMHMCMRRHAN